MRTRRIPSKSPIYRQIANFTFAWKSWRSKSGVRGRRVVGFTSAREALTKLLGCVWALPPRADASLIISARSRSNLVSPTLQSIGCPNGCIRILLVKARRRTLMPSWLSFVSITRPIGYPRMIFSGTRLLLLFYSRQQGARYGMLASSHTRQTWSLTFCPSCSVNMASKSTWRLFGRRRRLRLLCLLRPDLGHLLCIIRSLIILAGGLSLSCARRMHVGEG